MKPRDIIGGDVLAKFPRPCAAHFDLAHMAHIEKPGTAAHGQVLLDDSLVLDRHLPTGKLNHLRPSPPVRVIERSSFQSWRHKCRFCRDPLTARAGENLSPLSRY